MPRRKFIDKKTATTLHVLHRPQHDPTIYDEATPSVVFHEVGARTAGSSRDAPRPSQPLGASGRFTTLNDLASDYGGSIRGNEGEAAEYGVYYDDTEYDYMQHLRELGAGGGDANWLEPARSKGDGKRKQDLADALRTLNIEGEHDTDGNAPLLVPASIPSDARSAYSFPSMASEKSHTDRVIESQLSVPADIAGFQPDMDPRLREVLEALEDDAYVDANDEDGVFEELSGEGAEVSLDEFERLGEMMDEDDEDGWQSDDTVKAAEQASRSSSDGGVSLGAPGDLEGDADPQGDGAWLAEFSKFKKDQKSAKAAAPPSTMITGASSKLYDLPAPGRKKKRKGALTDASSYSMTSSSLFRNENQTLLDARFDKLEADYSADASEDYEDYDDDGGASLASGMTGASKMSSASAMSGFSSVSRASAVAQQPKTLRSDFDNIMDDFLGVANGATAAASKRQGKRSNRGKTPAGIGQLDEIRKGLGPARVSTSVQPT